MMVDYKQMYFKMITATEQSMEILIKAQQECEEIYISYDDSKECNHDKQDEP